MTKPSRQLITALKLDPEPAYKLAQRAGINPNTLSKLINGIDVLKPEDPRIVAVGKVLGIAASDCFE